MSAEFRDKVAERQERDAEREFMRAAEEAGYDVRPAAEVAAPTPIDQARRAGHGPTNDVARARVEPTTGAARQFRTPIAPTEASANRQERRALERATPLPSPPSERKAIYLNVPLEPIYLVDHLTGEEVVIPLRRVPRLQQPYLERARNRLFRVQDQLQRIEGKNRDEEALIDRLAGQYNALVEEFLGYAVDRDLGFLETLDTAEVDALCIAVQERVTAQRATTLPDQGGF